MTVDQEQTELETQVEEEFSSRAEEEAPEEEPQEEQEAEEEAPEAASGIDPEQAERLYRYFQSRPDMAQALVDLEQGRARVAPLQEEPPPKQEDDFSFWNDPEATVRQLHENQRNFENYIQQQTYSNNLGAIQTGKQVFAQQHPDLKPEEVETIADSLAQRGTFPAYWQRNPNHVGVAQALEDVYRAEHFDRGRTAVAKDLTKSAASKRRAASVGTSRASAPRTEPVPDDPKERRAAMVREIEDFLNNA